MQYDACILAVAHEYALCHHWLWIVTCAELPSETLSTLNTFLEDENQGKLAELCQCGCPNLLRDIQALAMVLETDGPQDI